MKRLLLLSVVFVSLTASAFDVPRYYLPKIKPAFSAPFVKVTTVTAVNQPGSESPLLVTLFVRAGYRDIGFQSTFNPANYARKLTVTATVNHGLGTIGFVWDVPIGGCCVSASMGNISCCPLATVVSGTASLNRYVGD